MLDFEACLQQITKDIASQTMQNAQNVERQAFKMLP